MLRVVRAIIGILWDFLKLGTLFLRPASAIRAENLALRKQLAAYMERGIKPRRLDHADRVSLSVLSRLFSWRNAIVIVRPSTVIRWHRVGWRIFWRWESRAGRPRIALELQRLIRRMASENPLWGEERIANELLGKARNSCLAANGTLQQLREAINEDRRHERLIHDRDRIFSKQLDGSIEALALEVLRSPIAAPKANSICERVIGTIRRECLDWMIPISEAHLRTILKEWVTHYNRGRPHSALGPGVPDPPQPTAVFPKPQSRHRLAAGALVRARSVLRGLHHEYSLAMTASTA